MIAIFANFINKFGVEDFSGSGVEHQFIGRSFDYSQPGQSLVTTVASLIGDVLMPAVVVGALVIITASGIRYIVSSGNEEQMEHSKKTLIYGIIGFILAIMSWTIINVTIKVIEGVSEAQVHISVTPKGGGEYEMGINGVPQEILDDPATQKKWYADGAEITECDGKDTCNHTFDSPGDHELKVVVTYPDGTTVENVENIYVPGEGEGTILSTLNGRDMSLTLDGIDPEKVTSVSWDFGDGSPPIICEGDAGCEGLNAKHNFASAGDYNVTATITNKDGTTQTVTQEVNMPETGDFYLEVMDGDTPFEKMIVLHGHEPSKFDLMNLNFGTAEGDEEPYNLDVVPFTFPKNGQYTVTATVWYLEDYAADQPQSDLTIIVDITEEPSLNCTSDNTELICEIEGAAESYIDHVVWYSDPGEEIDDCRNEGEILLCAHDYILAAGTHTMSAHIVYKGASGGSAVSDPDPDFDIRFDGAEQIQFTKSVPRDSSTGAEAIFLREFTVRNFNPDLLDKILVDYKGDGSFSPLTIDGNISGGEYTFEKMYDVPGVYNAKVKVIYNDANATEIPADVDSAVSIQYPEPFIELTDTGALKRIEIKNFGILKEVSRISLDVETLDETPVSTLPILGGGSGPAVYDLEKNKSYFIVAQISYKDIGHSETIIYEEEPIVIEEHDIDLTMYQNTDNPITNAPFNYDFTVSYTDVDECEKSFQLIGLKSGDIATYSAIVIASNPQTGTKSEVIMDNKYKTIASGTDRYTFNHTFRNELEKTIQVRMYIFYDQLEVQDGVFLDVTDMVTLNGTVDPEGCGR